MLEQDLLEFLPLSKASDSAQRRNLIFSAIDKLDKEYKNKNTLSQLEEELIRGFVAALVYEFVTDPDIYQNLQDFEGGYPTAPVENSQGIGLGISLRKASNIDCVRPFLEEVLDIVFSENPFELIELKDVDRVVRSASSSSAQQNTLQKTINKLTNLPTLVGDFKVIAKRSSLNAYRLFLYIRPSFNIWAKAAVNFLNSPYPKHFQINNILLNAALNIELNEQNRELFLDFIPYFDLNSRYIILGKLAQQDDKIIDWLMSQLPSAPPPESMRTVNALIIAAHRNKKAVEAYLEVKSNRHKYPNAVEEYALIGGYLDPANEEALASLLAEAVKPITERPSGVNDVPKPRSALQILNNLPALEPKALIYLIGVLSGSDSEIKTIASSLISRNREKLERGTNAKNMIEALLDVAATPIALIVDSGGGSNYLPFMKTLKEMVIITAVQIALDVQALDGGK
ncbi:MAG: hypothetical protein GWN62_30820, partial [Aliifodinibius sp.]|nr:hypothetical protein [Fodinibius sp.]